MLRSRSSEILDVLQRIRLRFLRTSALHLSVACSPHDEGLLGQAPSSSTTLGSFTACVSLPCPSSHAAFRIRIWQVVEHSVLYRTREWNCMYVADVTIVEGCSKRPSGKAAASEEARRYVPHFVGPFAFAMGLGEWKNPSSVSDFRETGIRVEPLSDARTTLADFFSILRGTIAHDVDSHLRGGRHESC